MSDYETRSGWYRQQEQGYRAFVPKPLPPHPPVELSLTLWKKLAEAERAVARLGAITETLPNPHVFTYMYLRNEAVLSSQIEGTQTTLMDLLAFEVDALEPDRPQDAFEVKNYVEALNYGLDRLQSLPISLRLIREIHSRLLAGGRGADRRPGEFRQIQNFIGGPADTPETADFVPPPPNEMSRALNELEQFIHDDSQLPVLLKIGLVHAQFETIHPFLVGNGRMGRLLITLLLCDAGLLNRPLLYLSYFFKKNHMEYYEYLQRTRDYGEWEEWLLFFLQGVAEVAFEAAETARRIVTLREEHRQMLTRELGRNVGRAIMLLEELYVRSVVSVGAVAEITGLTFANANGLVSQLQDLGLLLEITGRSRNRLFVYEPYLRILGSGRQ